MSLRFGDYQINLDAIAARLVYRWRSPLLIISTLLIVVAIAPSLVFVISEQMRPMAEVQIVAPESMTVTVDGAPWPADVRAGVRTIVGRIGDQVTRREVTLEPGTPVTVTLRAGWEPLIVNPVALPQNAEAFRIYRDQDAIRVDYRIMSANDAQSSNGTQTATAATVRREAIVFRNGVPERMATADAYNAWYDEATAQDRRVSVWARPLGNRGEFQVTLSSDQSISTTATSVDAVIADAQRNQALFITYEFGVSTIVTLKPNAQTETIGAVRGQLALRFWDERAAACILAFLERTTNQAPDRFTLVAVVMEPTPSLVSIAEFNAAPGEIVPLMTSDGDKIIWVVSDAQTSRILATRIRDRRIREEAVIPGPVRGIGRDPETGDLVIARLWRQQWDICRVTDSGLECVAALAATLDPETTLLIEGRRATPFVIGLQRNAAWSALPNESPSQ